MIPIGRPERMNHLQNRCSFFASRTDRDLAYWALDIVGDEAAVHLEVIHWSHNTLKQLHKDWDEITSWLKRWHIKKVIAANPHPDNGIWARFIKRVGFPKPQVILISTMEI